MSFLVRSTTLSAVRAFPSSQRCLGSSTLRCHEQNASDKSSDKEPKKAKLKENAIPATPVSRFMHMGSLAFDLGFGTITELARQKLTGKEANLRSAILTETNVEKIADTLCKMRGAALKLGQMLSIQDETLLPASLQKALSKVRSNANMMPAQQLNTVLATELGAEWSHKFASFTYEPIAAASIGQVHVAELQTSPKRDWTKAAIKIQYPGVSKSIESDLKLVSNLLANAGMMPKGMYINNTIRAARDELLQETDYLLEANFQERYAKSIQHLPEFVVPKVDRDLSTRNILTMEYCDGISMEALAEMDQATRNLVGEKLLNLCMVELFNLNLMQTDPNWSNFLYQPQTGKIVLLDFGASRTYRREFLGEYLRIVHAAAHQDKQTIIDGSVKLGFLTGDETKSMTEAHCQAVLALGEPFLKDTPYNWGEQQITQKIHTLIPKMLSERLTPPPQETYSIHRKLAGAYLLCAKLRSVFPARHLLLSAYEKFQSAQKSF
eukprot:TRINITY_DN17491_c0_g1_i1.p1 TRINITY_DN17491_c0_g1~~TRINITY_DN17491_c0_g1_i1.p1  ORF type:complete len:495 (+),score=96.99 TRINITY_DN17491_c0_g1_i1:61-1545(+)